MQQHSALQCAVCTSMRIKIPILDASIQTSPPCVTSTAWRPCSPSRRHGRQPRLLPSSPSPRLPLIEPAGNITQLRNKLVLHIVRAPSPFSLATFPRRRMRWGGWYWATARCSLTCMMSSSNSSLFVNVFLQPVTGHCTEDDFANSRITACFENWWPHTEL